MIGISVAESNEWESTLEFFNKTHDECDRFPFGEYFFTNIDNKNQFKKSYVKVIRGVKKFPLRLNNHPTLLKVYQLYL